MPVSDLDVLRVIDAADDDEALALVLALDAADRRRLAKSLRAALRARTPLTSDADRYLAMGILDVDDVRRFVGVWAPNDQRLFELLRHRSRRFRNAWVSMIMTESSWAPFAQAYRLISSGDADKPADDVFVPAMVYGTARLASDDWRGQSIAPVLRSDPVLRQALWSLFEVEGGGELSLAAHDKYTNEAASWTHALIELSNDGLLDRQRLLDASLEALERDFASFRAGWFARFHAALGPTLDEREARLPVYLRLLASSVTSTVSMARDSLVALDKAGRIEPGMFITSIASVSLSTASKATGVKLLQLARAAYRRDPSVGPATARWAADGLASDTLDIQERSWALVLDVAPEPDGSLSDLVASHLDSMHPSIVADVAGWLGRESDSYGSVPAGEDVRELVAGVHRFGGDVRERCGLDGLVEFVQRPPVDRSLLPPLELSGHRRLSAADAVQPIATAGELLERGAAALEDPADPVEVELVLDGFARLSLDAIADRERAALSKRVKARLANQESPSVQGVARVVAAAIGIAVDGTWRGGEAAAGPLSYQGLLRQRLRAVARSIRAGQPRTLLATPTHRGGWIDAETLVGRLRDAEPVASRSDPFDLTQALLRVAPPPVDVNHLMRGVPDDPLRRSVGAALRTPPRPAIEEFGYSMRDVHGSSLSWPRFQIDQDLDQPVTHEPLPVAVSVSRSAARGVVDALGAAAHDVRWARWLTISWPGVQEPLYALGAEALAGNIDWSGVAWGNRAILEPLLDPDEPVGPMAVLLTALGLGAREGGERQLATDVTVAAIGDGRLDALRLGRQLAGLLDIPGLITPTRWSAALDDVAADSALHAEVVADALEICVRDAAPAKVGSLLPLLDLLYRLCTRNERGVRPDVRDRLGSITGSSKTAKLARRLSVLDGDGAAARAAATALLVRAAVTRAERWQEIDERYGRDHGRQ